MVQRSPILNTFDTRGRHRLSKTRRRQKSGAAGIVTIAHQHITKPRIVNIRNTEHVRHVEEIEHFGNRLDGPAFPDPEHLRHSRSSPAVQNSTTSKIRGCWDRYYRAPAHY